MQHIASRWLHAFESRETEQLTIIYNELDRYSHELYTINYVFIELFNFKHKYPNPLLSLIILKWIQLCNEAATIVHFKAIDTLILHLEHKTCFDTDLQILAEIIKHNPQFIIKHFLFHTIVITGNVIMNFQTHNHSCIAHALIIILFLWKQYNYAGLFFVDEFSEEFILIISKLSNHPETNILSHATSILVLFSLFPQFYQCLTQKCSIDLQTCKLAIL